jgi:hypothetical protein
MLRKRLDHHPQANTVAISDQYILSSFIMGSSSNILSEPFAPNEKMTLWNKIVAGLYEYFTRHMYDEALVRQALNGLHAH